MKETSARPQLDELPFPVSIDRGQCYITIDPGAWDQMIETAYDQGWVLIEIEDEIPIRAFRKKEL